MGNKAKKVWRLIARILWTLACASLASVVLLGGILCFPGGLGMYVQMIVSDIIVLILPALTISLVLRALASCEKKHAQAIPHAAPLYIYEHPGQESNKLNFN